MWPLYLITDGFTRPPSVHLICSLSLSVWHSHSLVPTLDHHVQSLFQNPFSSPFWTPFWALFDALFFLHLFNSHPFDLSMHGDIATFITSHLLFAFLYPSHQHCLVWLWDCKECKVPDWSPSPQLYSFKPSGLFSWQCWDLNLRHYPFNLSCNPLTINLIIENHRWPTTLERTTFGWKAKFQNLCIVQAYAIIL